VSRGGRVLSVIAICLLLMLLIRRKARGDRRQRCWKSFLADGNQVEIVAPELTSNQRLPATGAR
jgi:hypothetical protein